MWYLTGGILLIIGLSITEIPSVEACTCSEQKIEEQLCQSSFVAAVRVKGFNTNVFGKVKYDIEVLKLLKGTPEAKKILKKDQAIWSSYAEGLATCGVILPIGSERILSGRMKENELHIDLCDLSEELHKYSPRDFIYKVVYEFKCPKNHEAPSRNLIY